MKKSAVKSQSRAKTATRGRTAAKETTPRKTAAKKSAAKKTAGSKSTAKKTTRRGAQRAAIAIKKRPEPPQRSVPAAADTGPQNGAAPRMPRPLLNSTHLSNQGASKIMADVTITVKPNGPFRVEGPIRLVDGKRRRMGSHRQARSFSVPLRCIHAQALLRRHTLQGRFRGSRSCGSRARSLRRTGR